MKVASMRFKVYYVASGFGLAKDANILKHNLNALGYDCQIIQLPPAHLRYGVFYKFFIDFFSKFNLIFLVKKIQRLFRKKPSVVALHLEKIFPEKLFLNEIHISIPNQEWFNVSSITQLQALDFVWCKTKIATNTFRELHSAVKYIGFCSDTGSDSFSVKSDECYFFSRIGRSAHRGGDLLIKVWAAHPEWPTLKIIMHPDLRPQHCPVNVECIDTVDDPDLFLTLSSSSPYHIYLSETEGFGHTIVEALGYGAMVLVTDAPPMNEVANSNCAIMVAAEYSGHKMLAPRFSALPQSLELAVNYALSLNDHELNRYRVAAIGQHQKLQQEFQEKLACAIKSI